MGNHPTIPVSMGRSYQLAADGPDIQGGFVFSHRFNVHDATVRNLSGIAVDSWIGLSFLGRVESFSKVYSSLVFRFC